MTERTADSVIADLKRIVASRQPLDRELWLESAFYLSVLRLDEAHKFNVLNQQVSKLKIDLYSQQEKKNVAAVEMQIEGSDKFRELKDQEAKIYTIDELIRVAKKNSDINF